MRFPVPLLALLDLLDEPWARAAVRGVDGTVEADAALRALLLPSLSPPSESPMAVLMAFRTSTLGVNFTAGFATAPVLPCAFASADGNTTTRAGNGR